MTSNFLVNEGWTKSSPFTEMADGLLHHGNEGQRYLFVQVECCGGCVLEIRDSTMLGITLLSCDLFRSQDSQLSNELAKVAGDHLCWKSDPVGAAYSFQKVFPAQLSEQQVAVEVAALASCLNLEVRNYLDLVKERL